MSGMCARAMRIRCAARTAEQPLRFALIQRDLGFGPNRTAHSEGRSIRAAFRFRGQRLGRCRCAPKTRPVQDARICRRVEIRLRTMQQAAVVPHQKIARTP